MPSVTRPLPPALQPYVESWTGFDYWLPADAVHVGKPSTSLTLVLSFTDPLDCGWADDSQRGGYPALLSGLHDRPALVHTHGRQYGMQLALTPRGARALFTQPAGRLSGQIMHTGDAHAAWGPNSVEHLAELDWQQRFDALERHLLRLTQQSGPGAHPAVSEAWWVIVGAHGNVRVDDVARHVGWSRRHLSSLFADEFGLSPKRLGQVARFERAARLQGDGWSLAGAAHAAGYADQAHMNREWRRLTGQTPRESAADFPIVQEPLIDAHP